MKSLCMILPLALILCFMVGCQDKEAMAELDAMKAQAAVEEQNKELVRKFFEKLDIGELESVKDLLAQDFLWYNPSNSVNPMSLEVILEADKMFRNAFPDLKHNFAELIAVENTVIVRFIVRTTHRGEFMGIPASGKEIGSSSILIIRITDGKFEEIREEYDGLGMMQQLGMELKPKEGEK